MKKNTILKSMSYIFFLIIPIFAFTTFPNSNNLFTIEIDVSPNVLNLNNNGVVVTVHTNIPYSAVVGSSCILNGVEIDHWKSDNRGYFVAKFNMDDIKALPLNIGDYNTFEMTGITVGNEEFYGVQEILVVQNIPKTRTVN